MASTESASIYKKSRFSPYTKSMASTGSASMSQGSTISVRQPMAPLRLVHFVNVQTQGNAIP